MQFTSHGPVVCRPRFARAVGRSLLATAALLVSGFSAAASPIDIPLGLGPSALLPSRGDIRGRRRRGRRPLPCRRPLRGRWLRDRQQVGQRRPDDGRHPALVDLRHRGLPQLRRDLGRPQQVVALHRHQRQRPGEPELAQPDDRRRHLPPPAAGRNPWRQRRRRHQEPRRPARPADIARAAGARRLRLPRQQHGLVLLEGGRRELHGAAGLDRDGPADRRHPLLRPRARPAELPGEHHGPAGPRDEAVVPARDRQKSADRERPARLLGPRRRLDRGRPRQRPDRPSGRARRIRHLPHPLHRTDAGAAHPPARRRLLEHEHRGPCGRAGARVRARPPSSPSRWRAGSSSASSTVRPTGRSRPGRGTRWLPPRSRTTDASASASRSASARSRRVPPAIRGRARRTPTSAWARCFSPAAR